MNFIRLKTYLKNKYFLLLQIIHGTLSLQRKRNNKKHLPPNETFISILLTLYNLALIDLILTGTTIDYIYSSHGCSVPSRDNNKDIK